jgi:Gpi18-like mannosyltransferase
LLILGGILLRLAIAPLGGHPGDLATLAGWADALPTPLSLSTIYLTTDANYPPLTLALLAGSRALAGSTQGALWLMLLKLPAILADGGIGWRVWRLARKNPHALWLVASIAFNPALIYMSAWWGQYESVYALPLLAALIAAGRGDSVRAGLWLGVGVMIKMQAVVALPAIYIALIASDPAGNWKQGTGNFLLSCLFPPALCLMPFALIGQGRLVLARLVALIAAPGWLTINALNLWYLIGGQAANWGYQKALVWPDSDLLITGLSARTLGLILLLGWTLLVIVLQWRRGTDRGAGYRAAALLVMGAFFWPTQSHERYLFAALPLMAGAVAISSRGWKLYLALIFVHSLNLMWAAPFSPWLDGWFAGQAGIGTILAGGIGVIMGFSVLQLLEQNMAGRVY